LVYRVDREKDSINTDPQAAQIAARKPCHITPLARFRCDGFDSRYDLEPTISRKPPKRLPGG
jgi:hypothetical protein